MNVTYNVLQFVNCDEMNTSFHFWLEISNLSSNYV